MEQIRDKTTAKVYNINAHTQSMNNSSSKFVEHNSGREDKYRYAVNPR